MSPSARRTAPRCHHYHQSRRSFLSIPAFPLLVPRTPSPSSSPSFHCSLSLTRVRSFARSHAHARTCKRAAGRHTYTHFYRRVLSLFLSLSLSYYPPTGSLFLRVTTQWRCHTLAPSSNQCYCFIVPLLLLLLDTRKGDPSIPESVRERRGRVASTRLALPRRAPPRFVSRLTKARAKAEPSRAKRYEALYGPNQSPYSLATHFEINVAVGLRLQMRFNTRI